MWHGSKRFEFEVAPTPARLPPKREGGGSARPKKCADDEKHDVFGDHLKS